MERRTRKAAKLTEVLLAISYVRPLLEQLDQRRAANAALTAAGWQVLSALGADKATVPEIASRLGRRRQTVQVAVDTLVANGHARKEANLHHARSPHIVMTNAGLHAFWDIVGQHVTWTNRQAKVFAEADLDAALRVLDEIRVLCSDR